MIKSLVITVLLALCSTSEGKYTIEFQSSKRLHSIFIL